MCVSHMYLTISNSFDYNNQNGVTSFKAGHREWKQYQMIDDFSKWGAETFGKSSLCLMENVLIRQHFRDISARQQRKRAQRKETNPRGQIEDERGWLPNTAESERCGQIWAII